MTAHPDNFAGRLASVCIPVQSGADWKSDSLVQIRLMKMIMVSPLNNSKYRKPIGLAVQPPEWLLVSSGLLDLRQKTKIPQDRKV